MSKKNNNENDSVFSDDQSLYSNKSKDIQSLDLENDHMAFFKKSVEHGNNGFLSQFTELTFDNPSDPSSSNNVNHKIGKYSNISKLEMERDLALKGGYSNFDTNTKMDYGIVDDKNFIHNNMVPWFKNGLGKGYEYESRETQHLNETNQRKLDLFTGSSKSVDYRPKTERRPLFNPQVGLTWIYGMPNFTDFYQSRYVPSKERRNEKLMQPIRVTPGLNKGYNEYSKQGFVEEFRVLPPTVDELRVANKPKIEYGSVVIPGMKGEKRSVIPNVEKHRPVRFKELDPRDLVKSLSYYRAPSIYGNVEAPDTGRNQTTTDWYGPAQYLKEQPTPESLLEKVKQSTKENFLHAVPRNVTGVDQDKNTSNMGNSYYIQPTNRLTTQNNTYINHAFPEYKKGTAFDMYTNIPDPTNRNISEQKNWLNPAMTEWQKGQAFDMYTNIPDLTKRNLSEQHNWLNPAGSEWQKGQSFDMKTNIPDPTKRNMSENVTWLNPTMPEWQKGQAFDMKTNVPDPTKRNISEQTTWLNPVGSEWQKGQAFDMKTNVPDPTKRNLSERITWLNPVGSEWQKGQAFDMKTNVPDPTKRNIIEENTWLNPATTAWQRGQAFDMETNIPDPTKRNIIEENTWLNPAVTAWQKGQAFDMKTNIPDPTKRNNTENTTWLNNIGTQWQKGQAFDMKTNIPDATKRNMIENNTWNNGLNPNGREKGGYTIENQNTIAPTTLRQLTENKTYLNSIGNQNYEKGAYQINVQNTVVPTTLRQSTEYKTYINPINPNNNEKGGYQVEVQNTIAPTTLRQTTENMTYINPLGTANMEKGSYQINVQNTVAPTTLRQSTENKTYINQPSATNREKGGYQVEVQNTIAPTTLRQLTENKTYQGPLILHEGSKQRNRNDINNSKVNISKDKINIVRDGGQPTLSNYNEGPTFDYTTVQLCEPIEINRDIYGQAIGQNPLQHLPQMYTRIGHQLPLDQYRFNTYVEKNLASNPYINNPVHKSVEY